MVKDNFRAKLIKLVIPLTVQFFLLCLVPVADAVMLVSLDQDAMSAVSLATQVAFVLQLFNFAITSGTSMFAAQFWGKGDIDSIEELYAYCIRLTLPIAAVFFGVTFLAPAWVMHLFTSEEAIIEYGAGYLRIAGFSYLLTGVMMVVETVMKNTDLIKPVTVLSSATVFINIGLNAVFIYGLLGAPKMGPAGAALATTISYAVSLVGSVIVQRKADRVHFRLRYFLKVSEDLRRDYIKYTSPVLANQLSWGIGFTMISVIMGHLGSDAVAANSIVAVVKDLISCFCFALSSGGAILVGNELGAGESGRAKQYGSRLCRLALYSGMIAGVLIALASPVIVRLVNITPEAAHYLQIMLLMCIYYMVGRSMNSVVISGIFCAGGDTRFGFICDTVTMWAFIVPVGALAAFVIKLPVLWVFFILNLDEIVKLPVVYRHYKKYLWVKNLTVKDSEV
ncbi:MAG: MATE family efflux transporter [Lachnospiraceae bacterium]|nr:MATE family efflux transporter [Lachnospiraceae bacterium]